MSGYVGIKTLVEVPDERDPVAGGHGDVFALGMDYVVFPVELAPVHHVVCGILACGELHGLVRYPGYVVRMRVTVHVGVHDMVGVLVVRETEQVQEALGEEQRDHVLVDELVHADRSNGFLHGFLLWWWKSEHSLPLCRIIGIPLPVYTTMARFRGIIKQNCFLLN